MNKTNFLILSCFFVFSTKAHASWIFNHDGGFGIYQPEGWISKHNGRSTQVFGPKTDFAQSIFFLGSDWNSKIQTAADLKRNIETQCGCKSQSLQISGLSAFQIGHTTRGQIYVFRAPENFIYIEFDIRGSQPQVEDARLMISSIQVRTRDSNE